MTKSNSPITQSKVTTVNHHYYKKKWIKIVAPDNMYKQQVSFRSVRTSKKSCVIMLIVRQKRVKT